jgi:hypothetical protein
MLEPEQGAWNQLWCAAGASKDTLRNGGFYKPIGVDCWESLIETARDEKLARELWQWTEKVLDKF